MTLDEVIKHAEEEAEQQDKLCKRYDDASGYTRSHNEDIRTIEAKECVKRAEEHRQIAEWLKELKMYREMIPSASEVFLAEIRKETEESDHKCHTCKHYTKGDYDGSCGSYICKGYSDWESEGKG